MNSIEPLEARIAPAFLLNYTDVDGDAVTFTISKGDLSSFNYVIVPKGLGMQLESVNLLVPSVFDGANFTISAKPQKIDGVLRGDGHADLGRLGTSGVSLGVVTIDGALGAIEAGSGVAGSVAVKTLSVQSLGERGIEAGGTDLRSQLRGSVGSLKVAGSIKSASFQIISGGSLGSAMIGGSIIGGSEAKSGEIFAEGTIGSVVVKGDLVGGAGSFSGSIRASDDIGSVTIGGSVLGGSGPDSGKINNGNSDALRLGVVKIAHDLKGGPGVGSGAIVAARDLAGVSVGGSVIGDGDRSGRIDASTIGTIIIRGSVLGGAGNDSGVIAHDGLVSLTILGNLVGGNDPNPTDATLLAQRTGLIFGNGTSETRKLVIGGSIIGGSGDLSGGLAGSSIGTASIRGDLLGSSGAGSGGLFTNSFSTLTIGGSVVGTSASSTGVINVAEDIGKVTIRGSIVGGDFALYAGAIYAPNGLIGSVKIGGDLRGGAGAGAGSEDIVGVILAERIGTVEIGGSILSNAASAPELGAAIVATETIGSIKVKGSLIGLNDRVKIFAGGLEGDPVANNFALNSLTVGGRVENAWIFGGVNEDGVGIAGNAQIGTVKVTGDWIASSLTTSGTSTNGIIGDGNDANFGTGTAGKIASIVIGGRVLGKAGTAETFGFFAREIGSFKSSGVALALTKGAGNDTFGVGGPSKAIAVGPTLSPSTFLKPDAFAVHVYEV